MTLRWYHFLGIVLAGCVAFIMFFSHIENYLVFFPEKDLELQPHDLGLDAEDAYVDTPDGVRLHGWFFPPPDAEAPVLLFCHGNAGNISHRLDNVQHLVRHGFGVFLFDYRGYGRSTGKPSEQGIYQDGWSAYSYLVNERKIPADRIVSFGRSLGGTVALEVALRHPVRCLILESTFTHTRGMARHMGPFALLSPVLPAHFNNLAKIPRLEGPKLLIHGTADDLVPFSMGQALFEAAREPKTFLPLEGAGHNDTYVKGGEPYFQALVGFAEEAG